MSHIRYRPPSGHTLLTGHVRSLRLRLFGCLVSAASVGIASSAGYAQTAPPAPGGGTAAPTATTPPAPPAPPAVHGTPIADPTKTAAAAPSPALLTSLIGPEIRMLAHPDAKVQATARQNLINGAIPLGGGTASPAYLSAYGTALNTALLPLFQNQDLRLRLNAAIVLGRVAGLMGNDRLAPAAAAALADKAEPVVLWGVKATKTIIPVQLDLAAAVRNTKLFDGVIQAVRRFPASGAIVEEAYDGFQSPAITAPTARPARRTEALPYVLSIMNARIDQFRRVDQQALDAAAAAGTDPPLPGAHGAESAIVAFLSATWPSVPAAQQKDIGRTLIDLLAELARLAPNLPARTPTDPPEAPRTQDLQTAMTRIGGAGVVILTAQKVDSAPARALSSLTLGAPATAFTTAATGMQTAFTSNGLLAPPRPAPAPAVPAPKPATGPGAAAAPKPAAPAAPATPAGKTGANGAGTGGAGAAGGGNK